MHYTWLVNFNLGPLLAFFYYYLCVRVYHPNDLKHRVSIFYPHFAAVQFALQQNWLKLRVSCPSRVLTAYFYAILSCTCRYKYPSWSSIRLRIKDICRLSRNWSLWNNCSGAQYYNLFERTHSCAITLLATFTCDQALLLLGGGRGEPDRGSLLHLLIRL